MAADSARRPAEAFPPGDFIREEIEARGWTDEQACDRLGWGPFVLRAVLRADVEVDAELAADLARAFGTSAAFWLGLQDIYTAWSEVPPDGR